MKLRWQDRRTKKPNLMKKLGPIICLTAMALGAYAQGTISGNTYNTGALVYTNGAAVGAGTGLISTSLGSNPLYELAVFTGPPTISGSQNDPLNGLWTFTGVYGTNDPLLTQKGGMRLNGAANGWPAGASNAFMLVVWSTSLGYDWNTVATGISNGFFNLTGPNPYGWFGFSGVGWLVSGGAGIPATPPTPIFGSVNPLGQPINTPIIISIPPFELIPEPATFALFGLGAAALLASRRKG